MANSARNKDGTFKPGHRAGGPGRPPKSREKNYQRAFRESVSMQDWICIIKRAVQQAKKGDSTARQWLTGWLCGSPDLYLHTFSTGEPATTGDNQFSEMSDAEFLQLARKLEKEIEEYEANPPSPDTNGSAGGESGDTSAQAVPNVEPKAGAAGTSTPKPKRKLPPRRKPVLPRKSKGKAR